MGHVAGFAMRTNDTRFALHAAAHACGRGFAPVLGVHTCIRQVDKVNGSSSPLASRPLTMDLSIKEARLSSLHHHPIVTAHLPIFNAILQGIAEDSAEAEGEDVGGALTKVHRPRWSRLVFLSTRVRVKLFAS